MSFSGHHDLYLHWSPFCFILKPQDESGTDPDGQENGQVRIPHGKHPSRVGHFHAPLSCPRSTGGFAPSRKCCAPYYDNSPVVESASTGCCCKTLASSQFCKNIWRRTCLAFHHSASIHIEVPYRAVQEYNIPEPHKGLIEHESQLISLVIGHLDINVPRSGWGSRDWRCFNLLGYHGLQVNIDLFVFKNTETALCRDSRLVRACWTENAY